MPSFALTLALCLAMAGNGVRPQLVEAGALGERRILVCSGADCEQTKLARDVESWLLKDGGFSTTNKLRAAFPGGDARAAIRSVPSPDGSRIAYAASQAGS